MRIILNSDDFGLDLSANQAILEAFERGLISSATIMPAGEAFDDACEIVHRRGLKRHIGLHFSLTEGLACSERMRTDRFFCDMRGVFKVRRNNLRWLSAAQMEVVHDELLEQIRRCRQAGLELTHVDSHHHIHEIWGVGRTFIRVAKQERIPFVRLARNSGASNGRILAVVRSVANWRIRREGLAGTDFFGSWKDYAHWRRYFRGDSQKASFEIVLHPIYQGDVLVDGTTRRPMSELLEDVPEYCEAVSFAGTKWNPDRKVVAEVARSPSMPGEPSLRGVQDISVVIPCFNAGSSIRRCLDSIYSQTLRPKDVIVIDDGSTDNSMEVVRQYAPKIVTAQQANQGPSAARNRGVGLAGGKFIALLDADDYWAPTFLEKTRRFLQEHPEAVAVSAGQRTKLFGHDEVVTPAILRGQHNLRPNVLENFFDFWSKHNHITTGSVLIRKEVYEATGGQRSDFRVCEDLEFWAYLATFGRWGFIPEPLFVSAPEIVEATIGWFNKHRLRWKNCPTVEQWESRIVPRLKETDWPGYRVSRGCVAQNMAHIQVLGCRDQEALHIVRKYGPMFPANRYGKWMLIGSGSPLAWAVCCRTLRVRERVKAILLATGRLWRKPEDPQISSAQEPRESN